MNLAVPLISAAIAGLVAWIVARHQGRTARENWVLDKRYAVYQRVIDATNDILGIPESNDRDAIIDDPVRRRPLVAALHQLDVIASDKVRDLGATVGELAYTGRFMSVEQRQAFIQSVNDLLPALREDLVPKHMR